MEGITINLPLVPTVSFLHEHRPLLQAYQDFLRTKPIIVCRAVGATEAVIQ